MTDIKQISLQVRHCRSRRDPGGQQWGPRTIPDNELVLIIRGKYGYEDQNGPLILEPGHLLFIEPELRHSFRKLPEQQDGLHACAHFDLIDTQGQRCWVSQLGLQVRRVTAVDDLDYFKMLFEQAARDFVSYTRLHHTVVDNAIRLVWLKTVEKWLDNRSQTISPILMEMMEYLRANLTRPITRQDLSRRFHYTPEHINYLFKKELGLSPSRFLNRERVIQAFKYLYEDGLSVQQAAAKTGFSSQYYFTRVFRDIFGYPPVRIRKYLRRELDSIYDKHIFKDSATP